MTQEHKQKISMALKGKPKSKIHKQNLSIAKTEFYKQETEEQKEKRRNKLKDYWREVNALISQMRETK